MTRLIAVLIAACFAFGAAPSFAQGTTTPADQQKMDKKADKQQKKAAKKAKKDQKKADKAAKKDAKKAQKDAEKDATK